MKTAADFKRALGDPAPEFEETIRQTLSSLTEKEARPMKKRFLYVLIPALLLISLTAYAAVTGGWGIEDFLSRHQHQVLPEGQQMASTANFTHTTGETSLVSFHVTQALHDGSRYYVVVEARPKTKNQLLVTTGDWERKEQKGGQWHPWDYLDQSPSIMGPDYAGAANSIGDYIEAQGLDVTLINFYLTEVGLPGSLFITDHVLNEEGCMQFLFGGTLETGEKEITLEIPFLHQLPDGSGREETTLFVSFPTNQPMARSSIEGPITFPETGLTVEKLDVTATPFALTVKIDFALAEASDPYKVQAMGVMTKGEDGVPQDVSLSFSSHNASEDGIHFTQETLLQPQARIPEALILCYYEETVEVSLIADPSTTPSENGWEIMDSSNQE